MAKKPTLSEQSFLAHLFSPKKNPLPSGLRKTQLTGLKGGRTKARLAAFNRMSPTSQEVLKRSGQREAYLRGESTLGDAKKELRKVAVNLGIARPTKPKPTRAAPTGSRSALDNAVFAHVKTKLQDAGKPVNINRLASGVPLLPEPVARDVLRWDYAKIKAAGTNGSQYEVIVDGQTRNPLWYH